MHPCSPVALRAKVLLGNAALGRSRAPIGVALAAWRAQHVLRRALPRLDGDHTVELLEELLLLPDVFAQRAGRSLQLRRDARVALGEAAELGDACGIAFRRRQKRRTLELTHALYGRFELGEVRVVLHSNVLTNCHRHV